MAQAFHAGQDGDARIRQALPQRAGGGLLKDSHHSRAELPGLGLQRLYAGAGRQGHHLDLLPLGAEVAHHLQGLGANGAGGAQQR